ncbi:MAG TPA: hypothetical protein VJ276_05860 [Thermoanaerobaculia bacterium]|nr:hypothetical protein [Thermoanaerobaculia bacterium]
MKRLAIALLLALPVLAADHGWGVRAGVSVDGHTQGVVGAEYLLGFGGVWVFNPNVELSRHVSLNADLAWRPGNWWIGGGVAEVAGGRDLGFAANVFAGFGGQRRRSPYVQIKRRIGDDEQTVVVAGFRF